MLDFRPICCAPAAFELLRSAREQLDTTVGLIEGAVAIARYEDPSVEVAPVRDALFEMARTIKGRVRGSQPQALLAHLHEHLFDEQGFTGNSEQYHDPSNSYLPSVLATRKGLPITLSLIYKIVADRVGLDVCGIGLPGHFCVAVTLPEREPMIIDPFYNGRLLNRMEAYERVCDTYGPHVDWSDEMLNCVSHRHWLTRMMQNLLHTFSEQDRHRDVAAMLELEMLLWPEQTHLQRDLALVLARAGEVHTASHWLTRYLANHPDDPKHDDLQQLLAVLSH